MPTCGKVGETKAEVGPDGGGMVEDVLRDDAVDARGGPLVCGFGDGGTEFRSGGIFEASDIVDVGVRELNYYLRGRGWFGVWARV
jgi:hypothetical protein